jgi:hypothetical protein
MTGEQLSWDEYPFASTQEGGDPMTASVRKVPLTEQNVQGAVIKNFYDAHLMTGGECFYVVITP